jgi:ribosomal protein S18 acetylase RimI-like enzyme
VERVDETVTEVLPITKDDLHTLEPLLRASFGRDDFDLADELAYFPDPAPNGWFWVRADGEALGFLRHYEAGNNVRVAELYPLETNALRLLLEHFKTQHGLTSDDRLRFDFNASTRFLEPVLDEFCTITETRTTYRFRKPLEPRDLESVRPVLEDDYPHLIRILAALRPFDLETLRAYADRDALHVVRADGMPVAAALTEQKPDGVLEIVALATDANQRQHGHGKALMQQLEASADARAIEFGVIASNHAAIALYESADYRRLEDATEIWCYTRWDEYV